MALPRLVNNHDELTIHAEKLGRVYVIDEDNLKLVAERKVWRPAKALAETNVAANKKKGDKK